MPTDLFNNPSNDYVNPGLAPCSGTSDSANFEFTDSGAAIISGAEIIQFMDLSDISIPVSGYIEEKKQIASGEVIYVPGLEKGLLNRTQVFDIPSTAVAVAALDPYYMVLDISISYYYNFRYFDINIEASANVNETLDIASAMNVQLAANNISATLSFDPSNFSFVGNTAGYDFDITNPTLTLIDSSMANGDGSPFDPVLIDGEVIPQVFTLVEDLTSEVYSAKYPNGAELGYLLKTTYPSTAGINDQWLYINTVESPYVVFEPVDNRFVDVDSLVLYDSLDYDGSLVWPMVIGDVSRNGFDFTLPAAFDPSIKYDVVDNSIITGNYILDSSITDSSISTSVLNNSNVTNGSITTSIVQGASTYTTITNSYVSDSSVKLLEGISTNFTNTIILDSSLYQGDVSLGIVIDSSISEMNVFDASISGGKILDTSLNNVFGDGTYISRGTIIDSEFKQSIFNNDTIITDSSIENSWTNAYPLTETLWTADSSTLIVNIYTSDIIDTSINNAIVTGSTIYTSDIQDSSLINCIIYNSDIAETVTITDCSVYAINATFDSSLAYEMDGSTYYQRFSKKVDVGMSGLGTSRTLSASEYLDYINTNGLWDKVGAFMAQISAFDPASSTTKNLIGGFYLFNPHTFPVNVEYMLIN